MERAWRYVTEYIYIYMYINIINCTAYIAVPAVVAKGLSLSGTPILEPYNDILAYALIVFLLILSLNYYYQYIYIYVLN